jgi:hypothetical protein
LAFVRGPVIIISPQGIFDRRLARRVIPWTAVRSIFTWSHLMVLDVDPDVESTLDLTPLARWTRGANRSVGADGLCITAEGLKLDHDTLLATSGAYWEAAASGRP